MKTRSSLLCVKSIITIVVVIGATVATFVYPEAMMDTFKSAVTMVITFYFAHQTDKSQTQTNTAYKEGKT